MRPSAGGQRSGRGELSPGRGEGAEGQRTWERERRRLPPGAGGGDLAVMFKGSEVGWFRSPCAVAQEELVAGVTPVRGWGHSLGKKWISCLLSINIPAAATNHKTAEGPIKQRRRGLGVGRAG